MSPVAVTDALANQPEYVVAIAELLGKGRKREVFRVVYEGKSRVKSVAFIAKKLGLTDKQVLDVGVSLVNGHAVLAERIDGKMAYSKIPALKPMRDKILSIAGDAEKIARVTTKRNRAPTGQPIFVQQKQISRQEVKTKRDLKAEENSPVSQHVVAMLTASPIGHGAIDVSMEAREVEIERRKSRLSDKFSLKVYPAAVAESLTQTLNEDKPSIIHFSGHGGYGAIVLDNTSIEKIGGTSVDMSLLTRILKTASVRPTLLVLNACDTLSGADKILDAVDIVIAMSEPIPDSAAYSYSRRLYAAIFSGLNIADSHEQACAVLAIDDPKGASLPTLLAAPRIDPKSISFG